MDVVRFVLKDLWVSGSHPGVSEYELTQPLNRKNAAVSCDFCLEPLMGLKARQFAKLLWSRYSLVSMYLLLFATHPSFG